MPKPNPSREVIINAIIKEIAVGNTRGKTLGKIGKRWEISRTSFDRYWKTANDRQSLRQERAQKASDKAYTETVVEAVKQGLKSKIEKQLHLQKMIEDVQADIDRGIMEDYIVISGKLQTVNKVMTASEKAYLRKTIRELYAELNKMDGDYTPAKVEHSGKIDTAIIQVFAPNKKDA